MRMHKDVPIPMRDGAALRANLFLPEGPARYPALVTLGPYGKDVHLSQFMPRAWETLKERYPEVLEASSCRYLSFETPDPEAWTPHGYALVRIDSRGAGKSPGRLDPNSPAEFRDFYDAIGWVASQAWCSGKVGLLGISYFAAGQWMIASQRPPHLAAMLPWQGASDFYRDRTRQGGIFCGGFTRRWWTQSVLRNQYGNPDCPFTDMVTGERNTGPASLSAAELEANRVDYVGNILAHPLDDEWYRSRSPRFEEIDIPALVVANWGGLGLHLRGTIHGWSSIASKHKWLRVQSGSYFHTFLAPENVALQRRFFDRTLKGIDNGWEREPRVQVAIRTLDDGVTREASGAAWPLEGVKPMPLFLSEASLEATAPEAPSTRSYEAMGEGIAFRTAPLVEPLEFAGPAKARLWVSSSTTDMDLFLTLRAYAPDGREASFFSAVEPRQPLSQGWLRVSQRKLDRRRSTELQPFHAHDERQPLVPGVPVEVEVEIWPFSLAAPPGTVLELRVQGRDFERSGFFIHDDPADRPAEVFGGTNTIYSGPQRPSCLVLPLLRN